MKYFKFMLIKNLMLHVRTLLYPVLKGKAISVQAWTGPEGSRMLRFPDFQTTGI
jgi:hypothetical protein